MGPLNFDWLIQTLAGPVLLLAVGLVVMYVLVRVAKRARWARPVLGAVNPDRAEALTQDEENAAAERERMRRAEAQLAWNDMSSVLRSPDFVEWQSAALAQFHEAELRQFDELGATCMPRIGDVKYPIVCFPAASHDVPASGFTAALLGATPTDLLEADLDPSADWLEGSTLPGWISQGGSAGQLRSDYYRLLYLSDTVHRWNQRGFELSEMSLDVSGKVCAGRAGQITFGQNCLTSHVLEYELVEKYQTAMAAALTSELRPRLEVVPSPAGGHTVRPVPPLGQRSPFHPLISVQGLVLFKDHDGVWRTWVMKRSATVSAKAGFWQFPPAGGFEIFGHEATDSAEVLMQFRLEDALIREFLEEIYRDRDLTSDIPDSQGISHLQSDGFRQFNALRSDGRVTLALMGVVLDLVPLRSEYSFLIIDDRGHLPAIHYDLPGGERASWGRGSKESDSMFAFTLPELGGQVSRPDLRWNPSSIGLINLFSDLASDPSSWLRQKWADMEFALPK